MSPVPMNPNQPTGFTPPPQPNPAAPQYFPPRNEPPTRVILVQGGLGRWSSRLGWILFIIALFYAISQYNKYSSYTQTNPKIEEKFVSHSETATDKVAIISVEGTIMLEDGFVKWQIDQARKDPDVKAVVLRVDSPGGTITGSNYIYHYLVELAKEKNIKLVVSMGSLAASGGYYVSMAVGDTPDSIYAEPASWTGSIGVLIPHYDISGLLEKLSVQDDTIASNPLKLLGSPTRKAPPELAAKEKAIFQTLVDESFKDFKEIIKAGRPFFRQNEKALDDLATGQIYSAKQALQLKLVDQLGYLDDAVDQAIKLNGLKADNVRVVKYNSTMGIFGGLIGESNVQKLAKGSQFDLAALLDLTAPRAYYLCTWLPAVAGH